MFTLVGQDRSKEPVEATLLVDVFSKQFAYHFPNNNGRPMIAEAMYPDLEHYEDTAQNGKKDFLESIIRLFGERIPEKRIMTLEQGLDSVTAYDCISLTYNNSLTKSPYAHTTNIKSKLSTHQIPGTNIRMEWRMCEGTKELNQEVISWLSQTRFPIGNIMSVQLDPRSLFEVAQYEKHRGYAQTKMGMTISMNRTVRDNQEMMNVQGPEKWREVYYATWVFTATKQDKPRKKK